MRANCSWREAGDSVLELAHQHGLGIAALALFQTLAHAHNRRDPELQRGQRALEHGLIGLGEILAAFAVPHNGVGGPHGGDHGTGDFAGEGALLGPCDVLRSNADARSLGGIDGRREVREGRTDHDLAMLGFFDQRPEFLEKLRRFPRAFCTSSNCPP